MYEYDVDPPSHAQAAATRTQASLAKHTITKRGMLATLCWETIKPGICSLISSICYARRSNAASARGSSHPWQAIMRRPSVAEPLLGAVDTAEHATPAYPCTANQSDLDMQSLSDRTAHHAPRCELAIARCKARDRGGAGEADSIGGKKEARGPRGLATTSSATAAATAGMDAVEDDCIFIFGLHVIS